MGEIKWIVSLALILVFAIAVTSYAVNYASDNDAVVSLSDDAELSSLSTELESEGGNLLTYSNSSSNSFFESEISEGDETTRTGGQFKSGSRAGVSALTDLMDVAFGKVFGSNTGFGIILTIFSSVVVLITFLLIWKTWAGRNPE